MHSTNQGDTEDRTYGPHFLSIVFSPGIDLIARTVKQATRWFRLEEPMLSKELDNRLQDKNTRVRFYEILNKSDSKFHDYDEIMRQLETTDSKE